jgi:hypothetical protein
MAYRKSGFRRLVVAGRAFRWRVREGREVLVLPDGDRSRPALRVTLGPDDPVALPGRVAGWVEQAMALGWPGTNDIRLDATVPPPPDGYPAGPVTVSAAALAVRARADDWEATDEPGVLLALGLPAAGPRKRRLLGVAVYRAVAHLARNRRSDRAADAAERFADGEITADELRAAGAEAHAAVLGSEPAWPAAHPARCAAYCLTLPDDPLPLNLFGNADAAARAAGETPDDAPLIREVFPNPLRPPPKLAWLARASAAVRGLAETAYAGKRWEVLPILADAMQDAGCTDEAALAHLRSPGPHARGCWALDAVLGRG